MRSADLKSTERTVLLPFILLFKGVAERSVEKPYHEERYHGYERNYSAREEFNAYRTHYRRKPRGSRCAEKCEYIEL